MKLGCLKDGKLLRAGLLLCGREEAIPEVLPDFVWTYLRMKSDTEYSDRKDGRAALPIALDQFEDRIALDNPIQTLELGLVHVEARSYPEIALREALLNSLCHCDFRLSGPVMVKQFSDRIEISNPGPFIGGISPENILHHPPVSRNPALVDALFRLRLVNRSNLGVSRMFESFLLDGKEPPSIEESGETVIVTMVKQEVSIPFRKFVREIAEGGNVLSVDELLILRYLTRHSELETSQAARLCQRPETTMRNTLSRMERELSLLERGGTGKGTYWILSRNAARKLTTRDKAEERIDWEAAKTRVLSTLKHRAESAEPGLSNSDLRKITSFNRDQVNRMMRELRQQHAEIQMLGKRKAARYVYDVDLGNS